MMNEDYFQLLLEK